MKIAYFADIAQDILPLIDPAAASAQEVVIRQGKFFECGKEFTDRSGHKFTVTETEADALLPSFSGAQLNQEHGPSIFDGLLGRVNRLWRDGKDIMAEYAIPKLLHQHMGGRPIKVSSEWDMTTKRPLGAALVMNPAVKDAVMMAAFSEGRAPLDAFLQFAMSRHNTPEGQMAMQDIHDMTARSGAVCDRTNTAKMASQHEATAVQRIHDIATDHGATCKAGEKPAYYSQKEKPNMTSWEKIVAFCKGKGMTDEEATAILADPPAGSTVPGMTESERLAFSQMQAKNERLETALIQKDAESFAEIEFAAGRLFPAERPALIAAFTQAAQDDAAAPKTVKFSVMEAGKETVKEGGRLDALKALYASRPANKLTQELVPGATYFSLHSQKQTTKDEELDALDKDARAWAEKQNNTGARQNSHAGNGTGRN